MSDITYYPIWDVVTSVTDPPSTNPDDGTQSEDSYTAPPDYQSAVPDYSNLSPSAVTLGDVASGYQAAADQAVNAGVTDYTQYQPPTGQIEDIQKPVAEDYMTPETTVAYQLEKYLDKGGVLQQQAQRHTRERASALNMMSTSIALADARAADVTALAPYAKADADSAKEFQLAQQQFDSTVSQIQTEAVVSGALNVQKAAITEQATRINQQWDAIMKNMDTQSQAMLEGLRGEWDEKMKVLEGEITKDLQQQTIDAEMESLIVSNAHDAMNNYQITIQNLLANESFLDNFDGNAAAMKAYFNDLFVTVESSIRYQAKAAGIYDTMKPYIDQLVASNAW